jgi:hypothetical protein
MGLISTLTGVRFFSTERVVFWREVSSGISIPAYYWGRVLSAVPLTLLYPLAYLSLYFSMGFPSVPFAFYYTVLLLACWVCFSVGVIISLLFQPKNAQIAGVVVALLGFLFGGHAPDVVTLEKTAVGRTGMALSYVRWSVAALLIKDASLAPACDVLGQVGALEHIGFITAELAGAGRQTGNSFNGAALETEVAHCRQMLTLLCVVYLVAASVLVWLTGKYRARTLGWSYCFPRKACARLQVRAFDLARRHHGRMPAWVIDALAGYQPLYEDDEEEDEGEGEGDGLGGHEGQPMYDPADEEVKGEGKRRGVQGAGQAGALGAQHVVHNNTTDEQSRGTEQAV